MCSLKFFEVENFAGRMTTKIFIPQNIQYMAAAVIDFSLIQAQLSIESKGGWLSGRDSSCIKWAWLRLLAKCMDSVAYEPPD